MDDQIRVALAENVMEAQIMVATLESEGIPAMTRSGTVGGLFPSAFTAGGIGPIEIIVLREHAERAYELLHPEP
jgi:hypothetical protein